MAAETSLISMVFSCTAESHGGEWGLASYLRWGIYTLIPNWAHSQNSLAPAEALSLKISYHKPFLKWSQRPSISAWEWS